MAKVTIQKNMSDPDPYKDDIPDVSTGATIGLKIERTMLAFSYVVMLVMACCNGWNYLIKKKMYKSFPISISYFILIIYSLLGIVFELYMSIGCSPHDCIAELYVLFDMTNNPEHIESNHKKKLKIMFTFWKIRNLLSWCMGWIQGITVLVLYFRISQI